MYFAGHFGCRPFCRVRSRRACREIVFRTAKKIRRFVVVGVATQTQSPAHLSPASFVFGFFKKETQGVPIGVEGVTVCACGFLLPEASSGEVVENAEAKAGISGGRE